MLERANVPALPADDAPLHVVGRKLDERHRRLRRGACGDALKRVRNEVAGSPPGLLAVVGLDLPHPSRKLVPYFLLGLVEDSPLRFLRRHAGDALELFPVRLPCLAQLLLELLQVGFTVADALRAPRELCQ